mmetsp:Transcript_88560/g.235681  ORF Transcript_88560/g.235681 Transcript_88560/m.235681 type:complete len:360 (-) Transcript_88560:382-1461(-)
MWLGGAPLGFGGSRPPSTFRRATLLGRASLRLLELLLPGFVHLVDHSLILEKLGLHLLFQLFADRLFLFFRHRPALCRRHPANLRFEPFVFGLQLLDECLRGIHVDFGLVFDLLCTVGVAKGAQRLVIVDISGREGADHDGLGIASQGVLQDGGELRLAVRHEHVLLGVVRLLSQRGDNVAKHSEGKVDGRAFLEAVARGARRLGALGPGKVHEVHLGLLLRVLAGALGVDLELRVADGHHRVCARRGRVHLRRRHRAVLGGGLDALVDLGVARHGPLGQAHHLHAGLGVHAHLESSRRVVFGEEVADLFVVDLEHLDGYLKLILASIRSPSDLIDTLENLVASDGHNAFVRSISNHTI